MTPITTIIAFPSEAAVPGWIESIERQTLPPDEILVVDHGLGSAARDRLNQLPGMRWLSQPRGDPDVDRRLALEQSDQPLVALGDPEVRWQPDHLARLAAALETSAEIAAAAAEVDRTGNGGRRMPAQEPPEIGVLDPWAVFPVNPIASAAQVLFRRQVLLDHGGWSVRYPGAAEFHAWLTLSARRPFLHVPAIRVTRVGDAASAVSQLRRRNRWESCDRYLTAAQDRVALRLRYHPAEAASVRSRLRLARHLFAWRFADSMLGPAQSTPMALEVEKLLGAEPRASQQRLLDLAFSFFPADEHPARFRKAVGLIRIWRRCPRDARNLRLALRQFLQRRVGGSLQPA